MSMVLQCKESSKPHPEGIHPAVCVDVVDLGLVEVEFQGQRKMVNKMKVVFETEARWEDGKNCTVSKNFTASLHPKAKLFEFLGKWRGRPVVPGETIDLSKLMGACCTLVISHQQNAVGRTYASIDAISKPTRKVTPSGQYDPAEMRRRIGESVARGGGWNGTNRPDRTNGVQRNGSGAAGSAAVCVRTGGQPPVPPVSAEAPVPKREAAPTAASPAYDPEVGF
jgi:hypothetical protein